MDNTTRVRVFVTIPIILRERINQNIRAKPDTENERILKCVQAGYDILTQKTAIPATTPTGAASPSG